MKSGGGQVWVGHQRVCWGLHRSAENAIGVVWVGLVSWVGLRGLLEWGQDRWVGQRGRHSWEWWLARWVGIISGAWKELHSGVALHDLLEWGFDRWVGL